MKYTMVIVLHNVELNSPDKKIITLKTMFNLKPKFIN